MKFAILSLVLAAAGMGTYGLRGDDARAATSGDDCRVEVECTPAGTCLVTCYAPDGSIRCQEELECDEPCAAAEACAPAEDCPPAGDCAAPKGCAPAR